MTRGSFVLSCEHGGNRVPARFRTAFAAATRALASHRGWDEGALPLARQFARRFDAPLVACTVTRLLVDANRSRDHRGLYSEWSRRLTPAEREHALARWWQPHRTAVEELVRARLKPNRPVLHLSVHSFTPRLENQVRNVDVALLYDPKRPGERSFAKTFLASLAAQRDDLRLRRNQPYRGDADGLTTTLRRGFAAPEYLGLELEVSQRFPRGAPDAWRRLRRDLTEALAATLDTGW